MFDLTKIRLFVTDLDGTLTDGIYAVSDHGIVSKSFHTRDFWAMQQLQEAGIPVLILTHCHDQVVVKKIEQLPQAAKENLHLQIVDWNTDKQKALEEWLRLGWISAYVLPEDIIDKERGWPPPKWDEIAYIGDNDNDVPAMEMAGWTACPSDATPMVKEHSNFICDAPGGRGAVWEAAMKLLEAREKR